MDKLGDVESLEVESEAAHIRTLVSVAMNGLGIEWWNIPGRCRRDILACREVGNLVREGNTQKTETW